MIILLTGKPGIGKTTLLARALESPVITDVVR